MPRRERGAGEAVAGDDGHARLRSGLDGDDGEIGGQVSDRAGGVGLRCDHENPVDALGAEAPDGVQDGDAVEGQEADDADEVARPVRGALDAEERRGRAVEGGVEAHDPERLRLPGRKCTRHRVRPVVEHPHRCEDSLARVVLDVVAAVDDPRDRLVRDPCEPATSAMTAARGRADGPLLPITIRSAQERGMSSMHQDQRPFDLTFRRC